MATTAVTEDYRCGYCWQEYMDMDDPRELPCSHVFCITCMQADYREKNGVLNCPYCQQVYETIDFGHLQKAKIVNHPDAPPPSTSTCDGANCGENLAVVFCVECVEKHCAQHQESHKLHFGADTHRVIPIAIYDESPDNFKKLTCDKHKERMIRACKVCDKLICGECERYDDACNEGNKHDFEEFRNLDQGLVDHYQALLRNADNKLTEICRLEKNTWNNLDNDDNIRKRMMEGAERDRDSKIRQAKFECEKILEKIKYDQDMPTNKVETFNRGLTAKKDELDDLRTSTRRLMRDGSTTEKIRQRKELTANLEQRIEEDIGSCELESYQLPRIEDILFDEKINVRDLDLISIGSCDMASKKTCYDIECLQTGEILSAGNRSFDICDRNGKILRTVFSKEGDFTSVQFYKEKIYTLLKEPKGSNVRMVIVFDAKTYQEDVRWTLPEYPYVSMLAVNDDRVYVVDNNNRKVVVYGLTGKHETDISHDAFRNPVYMCPHVDGGIVLSDWSAGTVYKIDAVANAVKWEMKVPSPRGVYCDRSGNVWVWSSKERAIHLRSANGNKKKTLKHEKLTASDIEYICGFTMVGDKLWGAACGRGIVRLQIDIAEAEAGEKEDN